MLLGLAMLLIIYRKTIGQISIMSYLIAGSISLFVITLSLELYNCEADKKIDNLAPTQRYGIISSISVIGMSCFYHMNVFGIYTSMRDKSVKKFLIGAPI